MDFEDIATGAGAFFKPGDHLDAPAILIEVKRFEPNRPGKFGPKDAVHADIHVFADAAALEAGAATVSQGGIINSNALTRDLAGLVGKATIVRLEEVFFKNANRDVPVFRQVDAATKAKVIEYAKAYTEAVNAAAEDAPDFD